MTYDEIIKSLKEDPLEELLKRADKIRREYVGEEVHLRGIIEFSNYCVNNCLYCGLRRDNHRLKRYRMKPQEIINLARNLIKQGVKTIVLQSGDDLAYKRDDITEIVKAIKQEGEVAITLSLGERPFSDYETWRQAGADRYLMKHETVNPELYAQLHPGKTFEGRLRHIVFLKELGYEIGVGNIVGLPGQSFEDLAGDILFIKEIEADMAGIGPFIPQENTPLADKPSGSVELTLRVLALVRIVAKTPHLPATTALATLGGEDAQLKALRGGANVIMPNFTPEEFSRNYKIYDGKTKVTFSRAKELIKKAGRKIGQDIGGSLRCRTHPKL
ncbi:[FeFe] hydrogenase H-cluster radical SAM maturase HydE [Thermodesulfatator indicus]|nr:[FeFe] hydrogenase H-cluster radical SAM maturase HydE [Thermodesulfatator indicus]